MDDSQQPDCTESIKVSSSVSSFLEIHARKALSAFRITFQENIHLTVMGGDQIHLKASRNALDKLKVILMDEPLKLVHSFEVTSWLSQNTASWHVFTNSLIAEYMCAIYTEIDFSKSFIFIAPHHYKQVAARIKTFLSHGKIKALPEDKISESSLTEYLEDNGEMILIEEKEKLNTSDSPLIKIDKSKESLEDFKCGQEMAISQSCLLNASLAELFSEFGDKILSDIQRNYEIIGNVFRSASSMNSLILNHQTDLICIVCSVPDGCPVDNYINFEYNVPDRQTEYTVAKNFPSGDKIWKGVTCNLPFNQILHVELPLMQMDDVTIHFETALEECFRILHDGNSFHSKITGIHLTVENLNVLNQFCSQLVAALQSFDETHQSDSLYKCITVMVDNPEIQVKITETISEMIKDKTEGYDEGEQAEENKNVQLGAISKISKVPRDEPEIHRDKPVLWVQLTDQSGNLENLRLAVDTLLRKLTEEKKNYTITQIHRNKLESVLFFFDKEIIKDVPNIKDQLAKSKENIITVVIPKNSQSNFRPKFRKLLKKIKKVLIDVQSYQETAHLNSILSKCNQEFPNVKCTYMEGRSNILIESLNLENCEIASRILKNLLAQPFYQENTNSEELPENMRENFGAEIESAEFKSGQLYFASTYLTIRVLWNDILSVNAEAIACPISSSMAQNSYICKSILNSAGTRVSKELMAFYEAYPDKMLPEGEVIIISAENLKCKVIIFLCCPQYMERKYDDCAIQNILIEAMSNLLLNVERYELKSVAFPVLGSGFYNIPLDLCLDASLNGITSFVNKSSNKHLQSISFVDILETNCNLIMNYLRIYDIPFEDNLEKEKPQRPVRERRQRSRRNPKQMKSIEQDLNSNPGSLELNTSNTLNSEEILDIRQTPVEEEYQAISMPQSRIRKIPVDEEYQAISMPQSQISSDLSPDPELFQLPSLPPLRQIPVEEEYQAVSMPQSRIRQTPVEEEYQAISMPQSQISSNLSSDRKLFRLPSLPPLRKPKQMKSIEQDLNSNPGSLELNKSNTLNSEEILDIRQIPVEEEYQAISMPQSQIRQTPVEEVFKAISMQRGRIRAVPCPVCFKPVTKPKMFDECQHAYCSECIREWLEVVGQECPLCMNMKPQPPGEMKIVLLKTSLPGFEEFLTYKISYTIPDGIQQNIHPNPGKMYHGTIRNAYLPASEQGKCTLKMLQKAFKEHLIFSVGDSLSTNMSDVVIWSGILHKSNRTGGPNRYGYPDPHYLDFVTAQLAEIGITAESVELEEIQSEIKSTPFSLEN